MRTKSLMLASVAMLLAMPVYAAQTATPAPAAAPAAKAQWQPPKSRQEAIARKKEQLAALEKMTDQEWQAREQRFQARREQWKKMTPEQRKAARGTWKAEDAKAPAVAR